MTITPSNLTGRPTGTLVYEHNNPTNISGAHTTLVKTGPGLLASLAINTGVAASTVTLYDSLTASGTKLATVSSAALGYLVFNVGFSIGLTMVTTDATDVTVSWR